MPIMVVMKKMLLCVYKHAVQAVIIEDAVVDTFRGSALVIALLTKHLYRGGHPHSGQVLTTLPYLESVQLFLHLEQCFFP